MRGKAKGRGKTGQWELSVPQGFDGVEIGSAAGGGGSRADAAEAGVAEEDGGGTPADEVAASGSAAGGAAPPDVLADDAWLARLRAQRPRTDGGRLVEPRGATEPRAQRAHSARDGGGRRGTCALFRSSSRISSPPYN